MKILLFTSQDISRKLTEFFLRKEGIELTVVTQVTRRDQIYGYESTTSFCAEHEITCWLPRRLDEDFVEKVRVLDPDIIVGMYRRSFLRDDITGIHFRVDIVHSHGEFLFAIQDSPWNGQGTSIERKVTGMHVYGA